MRSKEYLIDSPGPFDSLETWERFLTKMRSLHPTPNRDEAVRTAERMIMDKKARKWG
jgi:hypothetical protein